MSINHIKQILTNNFIVNFGKKPRVQTGACALIKVIFTAGIAYAASKRTREQWDFAFKNKIVIPFDPLNEDSSPGKKEAEKAAKLALKLFKHIETDLSEAELFEKILDSFEELQIEKITFTENFGRIQPGVKTAELFGNKIYQMQVDGKITYVARMGLLGEGGCNQVYLAVDILNAKLRIIRKVKYKEFVPMLQSLQAEYDLQEQMQKIEALRQKMIRVLGTSPTKGLLTFANLGSLQECLEKGILTPNEKKLILIEIFKIVSTMHQEGYVLGDIKIENILLKRNKEGKIAVKIADFGGSYHQDHIPQVCLFTVNYAAPEMYLEQVTTPATDLWMLGIIMHEMKHSQLKPEFIEESTNMAWTENGHLREVQARREAVQQLEDALIIFKDGINDPYDAIMASLLEFDPTNRTTEDICERLQELSEESFADI